MVVVCGGEKHLVPTEIERFKRLGPMTERRGNGLPWHGLHQEVWVMDDPPRFCCQNSNCRDHGDHGQRGLENLTACGHFGKARRIRLRYCRTCKARFSERKGTLLFNAKLPDDKNLSLLAHLHEGCGVRQTGRLGDCWDHVALDPAHRLVLSVVSGKRTAENIEKLVQDVKHRTEDRMLNLITTDEYPPYKQAILNAYGDEVIPPHTGKPGRPKAPYKTPPGELRYATVNKTRRKGRVVKVEGLADHVWSSVEWLALPAVQRT